MKLNTALLLLLTSCGAFAQGMCGSGTPAGLTTVGQLPYAPWCSGGVPGSAFMLEGHFQPGTVPLKRYYSPSAQTSVFGLSSTPTGLYPYDWVAQPAGQQGYLYSPKPQHFDTAAIYQWVRYTPNLAYQLGASSPGPEWTLFTFNNMGGSNVVGFAPMGQPPTFTQEEASTWTSSGSSFRMLRRCKTADRTSCAVIKRKVNPIDDATLSGATHRAVNKSAGRNTHKLSYTFVADAGFFDGANNSVHLTSGVRANLLGQSFTGVIVAVGRFGNRDGEDCPDSQVRVALEAYYKHSLVNGNNPVAKLSTASCSPALTATKKYRLEIKSKDSGYFEYSIFDHNSGALVHSYVNANIQSMFTVSINDVPTNLYPSGPSHVNAFIAPVWDPSLVETSVAIANISTSWTAE